MNVARAIGRYFGRKPPPTPVSTPPAPVVVVEPRTFASPMERIRSTGVFALDDIPLIVETISKYDIAHGTPWDDLRLAQLEMPQWFRFELDPLSQQYEDQQHRLWALVSGADRPYSPELDEKEAPLANVDAARRPGFFARRDPEAIEFAAHQFLATGMIVKYSGLKPGDRALEYGAGFAPTALQLARLGVSVDTVDISAAFCSYVKEQAAFFQVPLTPFLGQFGWNPRGAQKYNLIMFFESFHHCVDFKAVVHRLKDSLAPGGRVVLCGEPITATTTVAVPYPWGLRLNSEPIAQTRRFGWFELGFTEDFVVRLFTNAGFTPERIECPASIVAEGYVFQHRGSVVDLGAQWLPHAIAAGWHGREGAGRWTRGESTLFLDSTDSFATLEIDVSNYHPFDQPIEITYGESVQRAQIKPGERRTLVLDARQKAPELGIRARAYIPASDYPNKASPDSRPLGIFVHALRYR